jgi:Cu/Ag efflux protein CusF
MLATIVAIDRIHSKLRRLRLAGPLDRVGERVARSVGRSGDHHDETTLELYGRDRSDRGLQPLAPNGDAANKGNGGGNTPAMANMPQAAQRAEHMAEGTLNSVDQEAARVNITHGPVASAQWPAMTMSFKLADPGAASGLKPGQRVEFTSRSRAAWTRP